jgi:hypothetical protein
VRRTLTGEQKVEATVSKMEIVQQEGKRKVKREQTLYMFKTIIAGPKED